MKTILLTLFLCLSSLSYSQNVFNEEWYESLDEPVNFIVFKENNCENYIQFRIYRGDEEIYKIYLFRNEKLVYELELKREDQFDGSFFYPGVYQIKAVDSKGNFINKELIIGI